MAGRAQQSRDPAPRRRAPPVGAPGRLIGPVVAVILDPAPVVQAAWWADLATRRGRLVIAEPGGRVRAVCPRAAGAGLCPGQTVAQARLRCPAVRVVAPDRVAAALLWCVALRALTEEVAPVVEAADAARGVLYLAAHGLERRTGDPRVVSAVAHQALAALATRGIGARAGAGPRRAVARALAARMDDSGPRTLLGDAARAFLHDLPIDDPALALDDAVAAALRELGITTAGLLAALPERSLGLRYGPAAMRAWQAATEADEPPLYPWAAPPSHTVTARLDEPVEDATVVAALLGRLAGDLAARLQAGGHATATLALRVVCEPNLHGARVAAQDPPLHETRAIVAGALALWERLSVPAPVAEVTVEATDLVTPVVAQAGLWGPSIDPLAWRQERLTRAVAAHARRYGSGQMRQAHRDLRALDGWRWDAYEP